MLNNTSHNTNLRQKPQMTLTHLQTKAFEPFGQEKTAQGKMLI